MARASLLNRDLSALASVKTIRQWDLDEMFADEPDLQLMSAQHVAHQQVIRARVAVVICELDCSAHLRDHRFMCGEQPLDHGSHVLRAIGWSPHPPDLRSL